MTVPNATSTDGDADTPTVIERSTQPYAAIQRRVTMAEMGPVLPSVMGHVFGWLSAQDATPAGPPFWRYRVIDMASTLVIDVGVPTHDVLAGDQEVQTGELPAGRYASVRHTGHPDSLMQATADLLAWAEGEGLRFDSHETPGGDAWGCRLEIYETDPDDEPDLDRWVTQLAFRLAD